MLKCLSKSELIVKKLVMMFGCDIIGLMFFIGGGVMFST